MALPGGSSSYRGITNTNHGSGPQYAQYGNTIHYHAAGVKQWPKIRAWIFMPDPVLDHTGVYNRAQLEIKDQSTGRWLLESAELTRWKESPNSLMWLHGKMGCGKTVLCSSVARELMHEQNDRVVAHYYTTVTEPQTQLLNTLLRSLIDQIGAVNEITRRKTEEFYNDADQGTRAPYVPKLPDLLKDLLALHRPVFIIIDGLDESKELEDILDFVKKLIDWNLPGVHLLLSSRKYPSVRHPLFALKPESTTKILFKNVTTAEVNSDIKRHLRMKLKMKWPEEQQQRIVEELARSSEGIFRYVSVPLSKIEACRNQKDLDELLHHLRKTLAETYELFLKSVQPEEQPIVRHILEWVTLSKRPLTLSELAHTIPVNSREMPHFNESLELFDPQYIIDLCCPLIVVEDLSHFDDPQEDMALDTDRVHGDSVGDSLLSESSKIHLAHSSVREYLLGHDIKRSPAKFFSISETDSALTMAEALLAYGVHVGTRTASVTTDSDVNAKWPLFQYATDHWYFHAEDAKDVHKSKIESLLLESRDSTAQVYRLMTYPQPPTPFNPLSPPKSNWQQNGSLSEYPRQVDLCSACKELKLGSLKNLQRHRWCFLQLRGSRCPLCVLLLNSLIYQWISRKSHQFPIGTDLDAKKAEDTAGNTIAWQAGSSDILLYRDPTGDPFMIVQCLHFIGRLRLEYPATISTPKSRITPPEYFTLSGVLIPKISQWLRTCESQHISCTRTPCILEPFRLVEVGDDSRNPRLLVIDRSLDAPPRYTTLSCIGPPKSQRRRLTSWSNFKQYCQSIPLEHIPPVIMDAIKLTRGLGIRFLWVDRLCIVRDDLEETVKMFKEIPSIYSNSYLNIVAKVPDESVSLQPSHMESSRFPSYHAQDGLEELTIKWPASEAFYNMCGLNPQHYPNSWHFDSPPHRQPLILQGIRLAPRTLVLQTREDSLRSEQVYMQCKERVVWESGLERCTTLSEQTDERLDWYRTVESLSRIYWAKSSNRLNALMGFAQNSAKAFGGKYRAGLWVTDFIRGLLWYRLQPSNTDFRDQSKHAPTWSWALSRGRCVHYWPEDVVSTARIVGGNGHPQEEGFYDQNERLEGDCWCPLLIIEAPILQIDWSLCEASFGCYDIGCDQFKDRCSPLRVNCWFDTQNWTPNTPETCHDSVFMLQLTRRAGLLLRKKGIDLDADGDTDMENEKFVRVGLFVIAKSAGHPFESAETRQIRLE